MKYLVTWTTNEENGFQMFDSKEEAENYINQFSSQTGFAPTFHVIYGRELSVFPGRVTIEDPKNDKDAE